MKQSVHAARATSREARVAALRDGRKTRSGYHADKKKRANKNACRKGQWQ